MPLAEHADTVTSELLGVESMSGLASEMLKKCILADCRFEAGPFGAGDHSTASAGAIAFGLGDSTILGEAERSQLLDCCLGLIRPDGSVRGHDSSPSAGDTTWAIGQLAHGLLRWFATEIAAKAQIAALLRRLLEMQHPSGGWPVRPGDEPTTAFTFYPLLALSANSASTYVAAPELRVSIQAAIYFLERRMEGSADSLEERILGYTALERANRSIGEASSASRSLHLQALDSVTRNGQLLLSDRLLTTTQQPQWHALLWHPLLYLCTSRWAGPLHPTNILLLRALLDDFDPELRCWHGPAGYQSSKRGVSWASALAFRSVAVAGRRVAQLGLSQREIRRQLQNLEDPRYEFDVVISFGGPDRAIAERISGELKRAGLRVFYDRDYEHELLGEDLSILLQKTYFERSRFAVAVLSEHFVDSKWAGNWEWKAVLARMQSASSGYLLPYYADDIQVPGLNPTIGYINAREKTPEEFARVVARKVRGF